MTGLHFLLTLTTALLGDAHAVPIFVSPKSLFPSGEGDPSELRSNVLRTQEKIWIQVKTQGRTGWMEKEKQLHFWNFTTSAIVRRPSGGLKAGDRVEVLSLEPSEATVVKPSHWKQTHTVPLDNLLPNPKSLGGIWVDVKKGDRKFSRVQSVKDGELVLEDGSKLAVLKNLSLFHFMDSVKLRGQKGFHKVIQMTALGFLVGTDVKPVRFEDLEGWTLNPKLAFAKLNTEAALYENPQSRSKVLLKLAVGLHKLETLKEVKERWHLSSLGKKGRFWWTDAPRVFTTEPFWSVDELFARKIFQLETSPKNPSLVVASANGIFLSRDSGRTFQKLKHFPDSNQPVRFNGDGHLFVGNQVSRDGGFHFDEYFSWLTLAKLAQRELHGQNLVFDLLKILPQKNGEGLDLVVQVSDQQLVFTTFDLGKNWRVRSASRQTPSP